MTADDDLPCPACGFLTMAGSYGSFDICAVCGWEDDGVQLANPASGGGANRESLIEAQQAALADHSLDVQIARGVRRDPRWRPLNELEKAQANQQRSQRQWGNAAVVELSECYWTRTGRHDAG